MTSTRRNVSLPSLLLVAAIALAGPTSARGQVNIEALTRADPPFGRSGTLGGNLTVQTGNTDFVQLGLNGRHYVVDERVTTLMVGNGGLGFLGRSRFASSGLFHYRRTYTALHDWISPEWYGQVNYDRSRNLEFRILGGGGIRTAVARGEWGQFGAGTAIMLEHERLDIAEDAEHPKNTTFARSSSFLTLRLLPGEQLVITSTTYYQPRLTDLGDARLLESFALAAPISEDLALTVTFDLRYDSVPPDGVARLDTRLRTGVTYTY